MKFLLDTSFLMIPGTFGTDIFEELSKFGKTELYTLDLVVSELRTHAENGKGKTKSAARLALLLIEKKGVEIIETKKREKKADDELFKRGNKFVICTLDKNLAKRVKDYGGRVVFLRQQKYLEMEPGIDI